MIRHQTLQPFKGPEKDAFQLAAHFLRDVGVIHAIWLALPGGQNQLAAIEAVAAVVEGLQVAVGKRQQPGEHPALIALLALLFQIHAPLRGDQRLDVVGLTQGFHAHVIVDQQMDVLQIGAGKAVLGHLAHAAVLGVATKEMGQNGADLRLALAAAALDDHHALPFVAGNQAVTDVFLQGGDVIFIQKTMQKAQPRFRAGRGRVVDHWEAAAYDFILRRKE